MYTVKIVAQIHCTLEMWKSYNCEYILWNIIEPVDLWMCMQVHNSFGTETETYTQRNVMYWVCNLQICNLDEELSACSSAGCRFETLKLFTHSPAGEPGLRRGCHVSFQHSDQLCLRCSQRVVLWFGLLPLPQLLPHCSYFCQHLLHDSHRSGQVCVCMCNYMSLDRRGYSSHSKHLISHAAQKSLTLHHRSDRMRVRTSRLHRHSTL